MKELIKYSGLLIIFVGIVVLVVTFMSGIVDNTGLIVAALLVVAGFVTYLLTNRYLDL